MKHQNRSLLRLSGRGPESDPEQAPEQKSRQGDAAAVFRRFFNVLERLDRAFRRDSNHASDREKRS